METTSNVIEYNYTSKMHKSNIIMLYPKSQVHGHFSYILCSRFSKHRSSTDLCSVVIDKIDTLKCHKF